MMMHFPIDAHMEFYEDGYWTLYLGNLYGILGKSLDIWNKIDKEEISYENEQLKLIKLWYPFLIIS